MVDLEATVHAFAWMLLGAAIVGILAWRIRLPYAVALVACGVLANLASLFGLAWPVAISILAVLGSRVLVILGPPLLKAGRLTSRGERAVLVWGGLRGALTITLALALPPELAERQLLVGMAFGVVLFSLVVQGVTLPLVVRRASLARSA
jgi:CPA1 family monovalent cation:H+ antiporter